MDTQTVTFGDTHMTDAILSLGDIPDLSGIGEGESTFTPFVNGWYQGVILEKREFTDKNGNDRMFPSGDTVSQKGDSRNLALQVVLTRKDGKTLSSKATLNYRLEDLTQETVQQIAAVMAKAKESGEQAQWGPLFRSYMCLMRLSALQKIAGVRQLQRTSDGGLDITPLFGKTAYFRIKDDSRNAAYKEIDKFQATAPSKVPVL